MTAAYDHVIHENPQVRNADGKIFTSPGGKAHHGKVCRKLRALAQDDPQFAKDWNREVAQTVVELEDGSATVVLNDEVKG
jgi:hypothetical protein